MEALGVDVSEGSQDVPPYRLWGSGAIRPIATRRVGTESSEDGQRGGAEIMAGERER